MMGKPGLGLGATGGVANTSPRRLGGSAAIEVSSNSVLVPAGHVATSIAGWHPLLR